MSNESQQQEWTPEYVGSLVGETFNGAWKISDAHNAELADVRGKLSEAFDFNERLAKIADRLRTEAAYERQSRNLIMQDSLNLKKQFLEERQRADKNFAVLKWSDLRARSAQDAIDRAEDEAQRIRLQRIVADQVQELATERERFDTLQRQAGELHSRAHRAEQQILSAQAAIQFHNESDDAPCCYAIEYDKTILHQHDAEVRKPLVDALESIASNTCCDKCQEAALVAKDALAKVKEGK